MFQCIEGESNVRWRRWQWKCVCTYCWNDGVLWLLLYIFEILSRLLPHARVCGFVPFFRLMNDQNPHTHTFSFSFSHTSTTFLFTMFAFTHLLDVLYDIVSGNHIRRLLHSLVYFWRFCGRNRAPWIVSDLFAMWHLCAPFRRSPFIVYYINIIKCYEKSDASIHFLACVLCSPSFCWCVGHYATIRL